MKNRLTEVLSEKGIKPSELWLHLKVDRSNVYRWLANSTQPSDENKQRISEFVGVPIGDIFFQKKDARCATNTMSSAPTGTDG